MLQCSHVSGREGRGTVWQAGGGCPVRGYHMMVGGHGGWVVFVKGLGACCRSITLLIVSLHDQEHSVRLLRGQMLYSVAIGTFPDVNGALFAHICILFGLW
jgi:hypothetical protein